MVPQEGLGFWLEARLLAILVVGKSSEAWSPSNHLPGYQRNPIKRASGFVHRESGTEGGIQSFSAGILASLGLLKGLARRERGSTRFPALPQAVSYPS